METENTKITKEQLEWFERYETVRCTGKYNMFTNARDACIESGLLFEQYKFVMWNYSTLKDAYNNK